MQTMNCAGAAYLASSDDERHTLIMELESTLLSPLPSIEQEFPNLQSSLLWESIFGLPVSFDYKQEEWPVSEEDSEEVFNAGGPSYHIQFTLPNIEFIFHSDYVAFPPGHIIRYEILKNETGLPTQGEMRMKTAN